MCAKQNRFIALTNRQIDIHKVRENCKSIVCISALYLLLLLLFNFILLFLFFFCRVCVVCVCSLSEVSTNDMCRIGNAVRAVGSYMFCRLYAAHWLTQNRERFRTTCWRNAIWSFTKGTKGSFWLGWKMIIPQYIIRCTAHTHTRTYLRQKHRRRIQ